MPRFSVPVQLSILVLGFLLLSQETQANYDSKNTKDPEHQMSKSTALELIMSIPDDQYPLPVKTASKQPSRYRNSKEDICRVAVYFKLLAPYSPENTWSGVDDSETLIEIKTWSEEETNQIIHELKSIISTYPGLVSNAAGGESIRLVRINSFRNTGFLECVAAANTEEKMIAFTDSYFTSRKSKSGIELDSTLIHELVHVADIGHRYSYSEDWIKTAYPKIKPAIGLWKTKKNDYKEINKISKINKLPTSYSTYDLQECLADCVSNYSTRSYPDCETGKVLKEKITPKLFGNSIQEGRWAIYFKRGKRAFKAGNLKKAEIEILRAVQINPRVPELMDIQADILLFQKKEQKALKLSRESVKLIESVEFSGNTYPIVKLIEHHTDRLTRLGEFEEAIPYYNRLIDAGLFGFHAKRAHCYEKTGSYYKAAIDYDKSRFGRFNLPVSGFTPRPPDIKYRLKEINYELSKNPRSVQARIDRAYLFNSYDLNSYPKEKEKYFRTGLNDFNHLLALPNNNSILCKNKLSRKKLEAICAEFCYKNNQYTGAACHSQRALENNWENSSIKVYATFIGALKKLKKDKKANSVYKKLEKCLQASPQSAKIRYERATALSELDLPYYNFDNKKQKEFLLIELSYLLDCPDWEIKILAKGNPPEFTFNSVGKSHNEIEHKCANLSFELEKFEKTIYHCDNILSNSNENYKNDVFIMKIGACEKLKRGEAALACLNEFKKEYGY